jgi:hypothetical protein
VFVKLTESCCQKAIYNSLIFSRGFAAMKSIISHLHYLLSRKLLLAACGLLLVLQGLLIAPPAWAVTTQVTLSDLGYQECPSDLATGAVTSGGKTLTANCFMITGTAENKSSKPVIDADVFGRIYDANNNPVMANRGRLGAISEVPPGTSTFEMRITVPSEQPAPFKLDKFKASGFSGTVRPYSIMDEETEE